MSVSTFATPRPHVRSTPPEDPSPALVTERVRDAKSRRAALEVVQQVYLGEKGWINDTDREIPHAALDSEASSWFLARYGDEPAGVVRLSYDPSLTLPAAAGVELEPGIDLVELGSAGRFVEVGRLMIMRAYRSRTSVVLALMRAAVAEVVERGYSHILTAVFEDDPHSPYRFHTRVLGFEKIGSHRHGELACSSRRLLLVLDLARAVRQLRGSKARLAHALTGGLECRILRAGDAE